MRGRKIASSDPDLGAWTYAYDTASELVSQTDAKSQTTTFSYDLLGRMTGRVETDMTSAWVYDTEAWGIGKLASASITAGPSAGYERSFIYDSLGRTVQVTITIAGINYTFYASYDANSRLSTVTYPSGFVATYSYTSLGYAQEVFGGSQVYWTANTRDAELRLSQTAGNGVVTTQSFDPLTDRLTSILAGTGNAVESFSYTYDVLGNVLTRADANESLTETLTYDDLNRITSATVTANIAPEKTFSYNAIGNLLSKSDVGTYTYPVAGSALPHAVSQHRRHHQLDLHLRPQRQPDRGRRPQHHLHLLQQAGLDHPGIVHAVLLRRLRPPALHAKRARGHHALFQCLRGPCRAVLLRGSQWTDYLSVGGAKVGMRVLHSDETVSTRYFHTDHLGSIAVITNETGAVVERDSYDAWGKRRFATGADDPTGSITSQTIRGFTGQEELADVGLVHLNGRVYDPLVGRMMSADPFVPDPLNGQAWNRYAYVINNPLSITDPNGYCFLSLCSAGKAIGTFFNRSFGVLFRDVPILGSIFEIGAAALSSPDARRSWRGGDFATTFVSGVSSGNLGYALKAGAIAAFTAGAFYVVGNLTDVVNRIA